MPRSGAAAPPPDGISCLLPLATVARAIALLAALAPALVGLSPLDDVSSACVVVATGVGLALVVVLVGGRRSGAIVVGGAALAIAAGLLTAEARRRFDEASAREGAPSYDLRTATLPDPAPAWVELHGFFHDGFVLDEYAVADGDRPDQSRPAEAVLVPFAGTDEGVATLDGPIVIARVEPARARLTGPQTIRGRTRPASPEILAVLVRVEGVGDPARVRGVIVDTLEEGPRRGLPWIHAVLAAIAALAAMALYSRVAQRPS